MPCNAGSYTCINIALTIANYEACRQIGRETRESLEQHPGARFAILVIGTIPFNRRFWMKWAKIKGIDMSASARNLVRHPAMQRFDVLFGIEPARNSRLVRDHDTAIAMLPYHCQCSKRSIDPLDLIGPVGVTRVPVENTISVEQG